MLGGRQAGTQDDGCLQARHRAQECSHVGEQEGDRQPDG